MADYFDFYSPSHSFCVQLRNAKGLDSLSTPPHNPSSFLRSLRGVRFTRIEKPQVIVSVCSGRLAVQAGRFCSVFAFVVLVPH